MADTDSDWELIGKKWPYYGVFTAERFRHGSRQEFFDSGEIIIHGVAEKLRTLYGSFSPRRALDFGCGVGRLTIPLARRCQSVVGADVSQSMLREAENNCRQFGITNATFIKSDDSMPLDGEFDLIHSFIVFQHIPTKRGYVIFDRMLQMLSKGGIGAVHFTLKDERPRYRRMVSWLRRHIFRFDWLLNTLRGRPASEPAMQMNDYSACTLLSMLEKHGCREINLEPISYSRRFAAVLFFRKSTDLLRFTMARSNK